LHKVSKGIEKYQKVSKGITVLSQGGFCEEVIGGILDL
jgi:hypothetical protein